MDLPWTLAGLALSLFVAGLATFSLRRKRPLGDVRLVPWEGIMFVAIVATLLFARHLMNVIGMGPPTQ